MISLSIWTGQSLFVNYSRGQSQTIFIIITSAFVLCIASQKLLRLLCSALRQKQPLSIHNLRKQREQHPLRSAFLKLVDEDGAGAWPPVANHDNWPLVLRPYKDIYLMLAPSLPTAQISLDDDTNQNRRLSYRRQMQQLLKTQIDLSAVTEVLAEVESGQGKPLARDAFNGFYACVACLRHAYRWALNPIVKVAQQEQVVALPAELDAPWDYFRRYFDITSDGGNLMSNVLNNFDHNRQLMYKATTGMSSEITSTEYIFARTFLDAEILGLPIYFAMIQATMEFDRGEQSACFVHLEEVAEHLKVVFRHFYTNMHSSKLLHSTWMRYVQGIYAWGAKLTHGNEKSIVDGLSGSHIPILQAVDAFLGLDPYLSDELLARHISANQRDLFQNLRLHCFRKKLGETIEGRKLKDGFDAIVKQMRPTLQMFRAAHKTRAMPYLLVSTPERYPMTAGLSLTHGLADDTGDPEQWRELYEMMDRRFKDTV